jgi:hypothetical protein
VETFKLDYSILILFLYAVFLIYGYKLSVKRSSGVYENYWKVLSFFPILVYSLIEGLRYGRGVDYFVYKEIYDLSASKINVTGQPVFDFLNYVMNFLGFNSPMSFIIYSLITIICVLIFLRDHREVAKYLLPLFLAATLPISETFVRQFLSLAFVLLAMREILKENWKSFCLFSLIALLIHSASFFVLAIIVILKFYNKPINALFAIGVYLFFAFVFDMGNVSLLKPYIATLNIANARFQGYVENADAWFSQEAINKIYKQSLPAKLANTLFDLSVIFMTNKIFGKLSRKNISLILCYNLFVIGAWWFQAFFQIEIMRRIATVMYLFWFVLVAYINYHFPLRDETRLSYKICLIIILCFVIALIFKFIFMAESQLFIWDI